MTAKKRGAHHRLPEALTAAEEELAKAARREYMRRYMYARYHKNPEAQRRATMRYWLRKAKETQDVERG